MRYDIAAGVASHQLIAAVRARVPRGGVGQAFRGPLDQVWAFLRRHPDLRTDGQNLFLYHHDADDCGFLTVDFGVQVIREFAAEGEVRSVVTPAGPVIMTIHTGPYDRLPDAHAALHEWFRQHGKTIGDWSYELYGHWTEDPARLETTIAYSVAR